MADNKQKRTVLNTTMNEEVLNDFREYCKTINLPMNTVLETFMRQFAQGQFELKLAKMEVKIKEQGITKKGK